MVKLQKDSFSKFPKAYNFHQRLDKNYPAPEKTSGLEEENNVL
jgi:hypothetical protein